MPSESDFSGYVAAAVRARSNTLTRIWVEQLEQKLRVDRVDALPSAELLNHIPLVLDRIADFVADPDEDYLQAQVMHDLRELAELRRRQGFDIQSILEEFELLSMMMQDELEELLERYDGTATLRDAARVTGRLHQGLLSLSTVTSDFYRRRYVDDRRRRADLLGRFGRILTHELRNRLGAGQTAGIVLTEHEDDIPPQERHRHVSVMLRSIQAALDVVDDVQTLVATQASDAAFEGRSIALKPLIDRTLADLQPMAQEHDVLLRVDPETPTIPVPGGLVQIVLVNLVGNAIKYSDPEKDECRVDIGGCIEAGGLHIEVADNGIGIPEALHERIFEEFERGEEHTVEGLGLGLSIVREAVVRMEGRIWLESEPGVGTTFFVRLPITPGESAAGGDARGRGEDGEGDG